MRKLNPLLQVALTANTFEWYEFSLTAFMAYEIGRLFFPVDGARTAVLLSFAVFAASYLARPLGGVLLGLLGNRRGTAAALKLSILLMAAPMVAMAFLPTYAGAGYWATGMLITLKLLQGFGAGGEVPLNAYFVAQHCRSHERGWYTAMVAASGLLGMLMASGVVFLMPFVVARASALAPGSLMKTALGETWRWPFLLSIPLSLWIMRIRASVVGVIGGGEHASAEAVTHRPLAPLLQAAVLVGFVEVHLYVVFVWLPNYLHVYLGVPLALARTTNTLTLMALTGAVLACGYASRWIAAPRLALFGIGSITLTIYPLFVLLQNGDMASLLIMQLSSAAMGGSIIGVIFLLLVDMFRDNWKSLGMAVGFSLPNALLGGTAPLAAIFLIERTGLVTAPAFYIMALGVLAAPVAWQLSQSGKWRLDNPVMAAR